MEVVIALAIGEEGQQVIVPGAVTLGVGTAAPEMCQGINEEGDVMVNHQSQQTHQQQGTNDVAVPDAQQQRQTQVHEGSEGHVVLVLPHHDGVALQIPGIAEVLLIGAVLAQHPAHVAEPQAATGRVGVPVVVVDVAVMAAVVGGPDQDAVLQGARAPEGKEPFECGVRFVSLV